jgi:hypothetical protein
MNPIRPPPLTNHPAPPPPPNPASVDLCLRHRTADAAHFGGYGAGWVSSLVRSIGSLYSTDRVPAPQKDLS